MMKTIVVAVDGSQKALDGVRFVAPVAKGQGARLELVYVSPPVLLPPSVYADAIAKIEEAEKAHGDEVLGKAAALATELGVDSDRVRLSGAPAEAIADLAKAERVWAVAIGAHGHNALTRVMLGSVADRLAHICPKPVFIIR